MPPPQQPVLIDPNAFVAVLRQARIRAGGVNRLACYVMSKTGEPLDQKTIFRWLKGMNLPRQPRMQQLYAIFTGN
jgi:hypothetical protein